MLEVLIEALLLKRCSFKYFVLGVPRWKGIQDALESLSDGGGSSLLLQEADRTPTSAAKNI